MFFFCTLLSKTDNVHALQFTNVGVCQIFLSYMYIQITQCIKLIKIDTKYIYNITLMTGVIAAKNSAFPSQK